MRYVSSSEMREIDRIAIEEYGIPGIVLMENAVIKVLNHIPKDKTSYTVVVGAGNNGGDGIGVARHLHIAGKRVNVILMEAPEKLRGDSLANYRVIRELAKRDRENRLRILKYETTPSELTSQIIGESDMVIDAIFGTGLSKEVQGKYRKVIETINKESKYTLSIDIPSGLSADRGEVMGLAIESDKTVTLQYPKLGFKDRQALKYTGELVVEEIGIPKDIWVQRVL